MEAAKPSARKTPADDPAAAQVGQRSAQGSATNAKASAAADSPNAVLRPTPAMLDLARALARRDAASMVAAVFSDSDLVP